MRNPDWARLPIPRGPSLAERVTGPSSFVPSTQSFLRGRVMEVGVASYLQIGGRGRRGGERQGGSEEGKEGAKSSTHLFDLFLASTTSPHHSHLLLTLPPAPTLTCKTARLSSLPLLKTSLSPAKWPASGCPSRIWCRDQTNKPYLRCRSFGGSSFPPGPWRPLCPRREVVEGVAGCCFKGVLGAVFSKGSR